MPKQIQEAPIPTLGGQGNRPHSNIQQQNFFIGEGQRQHEPMEAATSVANHGHQPQYRYISPGRMENVGPHHQPHPRDFFQPQVSPAQSVQCGLQNQSTQLCNRGQLIDLVQETYEPALRPLEKVDKGILKFPNKVKETMGVDANPFSVVFVGMKVANLRSVARNYSLPYAQRHLAAEDLRWVIEAQKSKHSKSVRSDQQRLGGQGRMIVTRNFSPEGARRYSVVFQAKKEEEPIVYEFPEQTEEEAIIVPAQDDEEEDMADKIVFEKPEEKMANHVRPLYINAHMNGTPINRVLVDNGAAVNVLPTCMLYKIGKSLDDLVHTKVIISDFTKRGEEADQGDKITLEELDLAPVKLDDLKAEVQDPLKEINLGSESEPKVTFISGSLEPRLDQKLVEHKLPIAEGFRSYEQPPRRMSAEVNLKVKEEIERLNAGATYQRAMNAIFHDMIGKFMEIYIDDVVVKSHGDEDHLVHLRKSFERMRQHGLKMNPLKCAFGVFAGNFLGYLVHERGLEVDRNKARVVIEAKPPHNKKELQRFLGQVNLLRRFISNLVGKTRVFSPLLNFKFEADFKWEEQHQSTFDMIKHTETMSGVGVEVISPSGLKTQMSLQLNFNCTNNQAEYEALIIGLEMLVELKVSMVKFDDVSIRHVPRDQNYEANEMAQIASGLRIPEGYLKDQGTKVSRKTKMQALNYVLIKDMLYRRGHDELLLRCLGPDESFQMFSDVHDGICGAHQARIKMRWLIHRYGFFWLFVLKDCIAYAKGCKSCQIHRPLQKVLASELNSIVKLCPFRGWAIDLIDKVYLPSSTDIIHRFGLPETITTDQGTVFVNYQVEAFANEMGFRLLNSTSHYAQANGQAEASNKVVINLLEKMVDENPRRWHELLSETPWAYRTSQRSSTKITPFALTYGHDAVLPMELTARSLRIAIQHNLQSGEYDEAMMLELEDLKDTRLAALNRLQAQKLKIAKPYNKRVKCKNLAVGDLGLVWHSGFGIAVSGFT
ncbi:hypothetical protein SLEP1_g27682 [Rubroshorea leprosula]|uniref:Integrase catalytic domain-containing protein n=1 Tax=Rubroshorea leprosula TaxID=152421 RepID=A0AAV5K1Y9_9ROSI|nr:hypothetical protein SLEP1_g27682 [Rubroshorea leprosula]